ncbi:MAG: DUF4384 domain-containing protein, partial [Candidatus Eiseniibacteriota bacterium]
MRARIRIAPALWALPLLAVLGIAPQARAQAIDVKVWTDRGNDAVYQPGDAMQVGVKLGEDAYLLVYEIDSDGFVHVLYPTQGESGQAPGGHSLNFPDPTGDRELVVENNTGQDYIVAIASRHAFDDLPWYLRPYNAQGDAMGYVNQPQADEEGITTDGRIVGDPFVAMERIRRRVLSQPGDENAFGTAFTTYYVHEQVQYPRYICNDCHRPGHWAWWDGWDPYYSTCSAVSFRINWSWAWGPSYWYGAVPYYVYAYRPGCAPQWRWPGGSWCSSWDGWNRWTQYWNGGLVRYKSPPPVGYNSPASYPNWRGGAAPPPPGLLVRGHNSRAPLAPGDGSLAGTQIKRSISAQRMPVSGDNTHDGQLAARGNRTPGAGGGPQAERMPATRGEDPVYVRPDRSVGRGASSPWRIQDSPRFGRGDAGRQPAGRVRIGDWGGT